MKEQLKDAEQELQNQRGVFEKTKEDLQKTKYEFENFRLQGNTFKT